MKICMIAFGMFDYTVALTSALSKRCTVDFYYPEYPMKFQDPTILSILGNNVRIFRFGSYRVRDIKNVADYLKLCNEISSRNYEVIHFQTPGTIWMSLFWKSLKRLPLVITIHDPYQLSGIPFMQKLQLYFSEKIFVPKARKIIVHGKILKEQFLKKFPRKDEKDVIILSHGDFSILKRFDVLEKNNKKETTTKTILFFGSDRKNKGLEYLIKAEPIIRKKFDNYRIVIAGKCSDIHKYEKIICNNSKIQIVNKFIPSKEVAKYFREASFVVLPYISASQTGIIPLAYAFGNPVVASNVGAIPEVVENGETGILVEPCNEMALANAIAKLLSNDELLFNMGKNALKYKELHMSWESIAQQTLEIYEEVAKQVL